MSRLEELLEGLAEEGTRHDSGQFTLSASQVWQKLGSSLEDPSALPRFLARWMLDSPARPALVNFELDAKRLVVRAADLRNPSALPRACPNPDFSGADLDLARAVICAHTLQAQKLELVFHTPTQEWQGRFPQLGSVEWRQEPPSGEPFQLVFSAELPRSAQKLAKSSWQTMLSQQFALCGPRLQWNGQTIGGTLRLSEGPLVWRRITPRTGGPPLLSFAPPTRGLHFVSAKHEHSEIVMALCNRKESFLRVVSRGELVPLSKPGFLTGFEVYLNSSRLSFDMKGTVLVWNRQLESLLQEIKEEAYDMVLQVYRAEPQPEAGELLRHFEGLQSVLFYLLEEQRWDEGYYLASWLDQRLDAELAILPARQRYTFYRTSEHFANQANHPRTAQRFARQARDAAPPSEQDWGVETALIDAYLDGKVRRDSPDRLGHDLRSRMHLLAVRCLNAGRFEHAFQLFNQLTKAHREISYESLDLWFQTAGLAKDLNRPEALKRLLKQLKRSQEKGAVNLSPSVRTRANQFADFVKGKSR